MAEKGQGRGLSRDAAGAFHDDGGVLLDGLCQFGASIESMHPPGQQVAGVQIAGLRRPYHTSWNIPFEWLSLDAGKGLTDVEAEAGVKRERAIVECGLYQPHSCGAALVGPIHRACISFRPMPRFCALG